MKTGDKIYLKPIGNAARYNKEPIQVEVSKVATKFFYVNPYHYGRFFIESKIQDGGQYSGNYIAYNTLQEIQDEKELRDNVTLIEKNIKRIDLNTSRQILALITILNK